MKNLFFCLIVIASSMVLLTAFTTFEKTNELSAEVILTDGISGKVTYNSGGQSNRIVSLLYEGEFLLSTTTDASGNYHFPGVLLEDGDYIIKCSFCIGSDLMSRTVSTSYSGSPVTVNLLLIKTIGGCGS